MYKKYQRSFLHDSQSCNTECSLAQNYTIKTSGFPLVPEHFKHIRIEKIFTVEACDCTAQPCPHQEDIDFTLFIKYLPGRLEMIQNDHLAIENLYIKLKQRLASHTCNIETKKITEFDACFFDPNASYNTDSEESELASESEQDPQNCHYCRAIEEIFNYPQLIPLKPQKKKLQLAGLVINLSFISNILLLILKIIAYFCSRSMSIMASMVDSALDILSGLVLFIAMKMAKKGVAQGKYQEYIHSQEAASVLYSSRYESLGVLAFSCFMSMLSLLLVKDSIVEIVKISKGEGSILEVKALPVSIMAVTIVVKMILCFLAQVAYKRSRVQKEALLAYRDDHRNDVLTNIVSLAGIIVSGIGSYWVYADPIASGALCSFIFFNWTRSGIEQMKSMVGKVLKDDDLVPYYTKLLSSFICSSRIEKIQRILAYNQGSSINLEISLQIPDTLTVCDSHEIAQVVQNEFEQMDGVERCFVHLESDKCNHNFESFERREGV